MKLTPEQAKAIASLKRVRKQGKRPSRLLELRAQGYSEAHARVIVQEARDAAAD